MGVDSKINKLIKALHYKCGRIYKINTMQYFSKKSLKIVTKYTVFQYHPKSDGEDFYSKIDLLKYLVKEYKWLTTGGDPNEDD